ncbi:hypothetical protein [Phenylobacterium sp.]|uniref:hypothetical protein n=1 Tax=Phenylobacterium sp. TaxID=1871053 RepID=UPI0035B23293
MALPKPPSPMRRRLLGSRRAPSSSPHGAAPPPHRFSPGRAAAGAALAAIGAISLTAQIALLNCSAAACEAAIIDIGLALGAMISAVSQLALLAGLWLLWSSRSGAP